jgi:peptidoglycan/LPS O-acetylase OafA/YrhL
MCQAGGGTGMKQAAERHAGLTRLRFFLIGWVVLYHLDLPLHLGERWTLLRPVLWRGYLGVDGFFLLSGFALWLGYGARPPRGLANIGRFLLRRVAKIWPLHLAALLALAMLIGLTVAFGAQIRDPGRFGARDFVLQVLLLNGWETSSRFAWNYPSWALSVEWAGYLAFPALLALLLRVPGRAIAAVPVLGFLGLWWLSGQGRPGSLNHSVHLGLLRFGFEFAIGLGLGRLATEGRLPRAVPWAMLAGLPLGLWSGADPLAVLGLTGAMLGIWRAGLGPSSLPRPGLLLRLGEASFGIYLSWVFVEVLVVGVLRLGEPGPWGRVAIMLGGFAMTLAIGWCAWRWVEVPAHAWILRRYGNPGSLRPARLDSAYAEGLPSRPAAGRPGH